MTSSWKDAVVGAPSGVLVRVHVVPGSSKTVFPVGYNEWRRCLEIKVKGEAKDNKANAEVLETVAGFFHCASKDVRIVKGEKSREKTVLLAGVARDDVLAKLEVSLHGP